MMRTAVYNRNSDDEIVSSFSYTYRGDGNIATETDHNNVTTAYTYDLLGRLVSEVGRAINAILKSFIPSSIDKMRAIIEEHITGRMVNETD